MTEIPPHFKGLAGITVDGTITLGKHVICDGFMHQRQISVFTHIHNDHIRQFESALGFYNVYVTKQTRDLLVKMKDDMSLSFRNNLFTCDYGKPFYYDDEKITLQSSRHILGSCQVAVESNGLTIAYTGDFDMPGTEPQKCDILIIDATHGSKDYSLDYSKDEILGDFIKVVQRELSDGKPVRISAHTGQIHELMSKLSQELDERIPFIASEKDREIANVFRSNSYQIREMFGETSPDAAFLLKTKKPYVRFMSRNAGADTNDPDLCSIRIASDIAFRGRPWYQIENASKYSFNLSNHADFKGILEYVDRSGAKLVITDKTRSYYATNLAKEIKDRLKKDAVAMPY